MNITIYIASLQKGFFISLAKVLAEEHTVSLVARDDNVADLVRRLAPELAGSMDVQSRFVPPPVDDPVARALEVERRYDVSCAMLMSYDRGLGRGYIFNVDRFPQVGRAWWSHERKLEYFLGGVAYMEHVFDRFKPDCFLGIFSEELVELIARHRGVAYHNIVSAKHGQRLLWSDDPYMGNKTLFQALERSLAENLEPTEALPEYVQEKASQLQLMSVRYSWRLALRTALRIAVSDTKALLLGRHKADTYKPYGWLPSVIRKPFMYRYFLRRGLRPQDLAGQRIVYYPLHLEPEIAVQALSPELNNTMELVAWISKSLPADCRIVLKEQPYCFGVRSKDYYDRLSQISNVVLADPRVSSWEWIKASSLVASITGTAAIEAVHFEKPVLSYGAHQIVNRLPSVRHADSFGTTRDAVRELLALAPDDPVLRRSRAALWRAQHESSFELPGFETSYGSVELDMDMARTAAAELWRFHPELLDRG